MGDEERSDEDRSDRARQPLVLDDGYLPLGELATYSGLSVRTLQALLVDADHPLPHYRFGRKIVVKRSEFDAWAREHYRHERAPNEINDFIERMKER